MRTACLAMCIAVPAHAWEFTPDPICTIWHETDTARLTVSYDPSLPQPYTLDLRRDTPLPPGPVFAMNFRGIGEFTITTSRHRLSEDNRRLTVTDTGFGNVLSGLEFNAVANALIGETVEPFPLDDAAPAVRAFRDCPTAVTS